MVGCSPTGRPGGVFYYYLRAKIFIKSVYFILNKTLDYARKTKIGLLST